MGKVAKGRDVWRTCENCTSVSVETCRSEDLKCVLRDAHALFPSLGWNMCISNADGLPTLAFASLLDMDSLMNRTVQLMLNQLSEKLHTSDQATSTLIVGPEFA